MMADTFNPGIGRLKQETVREFQPGLHSEVLGEKMSNCSKTKDFIAMPCIARPQGQDAEWSKTVTVVCSYPEGKLELS